MRLFRVVWSAVLLTACSGTSGLPTEPAVRLDGVNDSLALTATVSPATITPGDTAWVTVTLTNRLDRNLTVHFSSGCQLLYYAEDALGRDAMDHGGFACTGALTELRLEAGGTRQGRFAWTAMEFTYPPPGYRPRPPGAYRLYGVLGFPPKGFMQSAPVEVTVR